MKVFYRFADKVIVNSQHTKKIFSKKIKCNLDLIYSPSIDKIKLNNSNRINKKLKIILKLKDKFEKKGMIFSGLSPDNKLPI